VWTRPILLGQENNQTKTLLERAVVFKEGNEREKKKGESKTYALHRDITMSKELHQQKRGQIRGAMSPCNRKGAPSQSTKPQSKLRAHEATSATEDVQQKEGKSLSPKMEPRFTWKNYQPMGQENRVPIEQKLEILSPVTQTDAVRKMRRGFPIKALRKARQTTPKRKKKKSGAARSSNANTSRARGARWQWEKRGFQGNGKAASKKTGCAALPALKL